MRRAQLVWAAGAAVAVAFALGGDQGASIAARGAVAALSVASIVVLTGWSGQLNLHVAAIGLGWGAYAAAGLAANGVPSLLAVVLAPVLVIPAALIVGVIAVRFRGLELAIATIAVGLAFEQMAFQNLGKWLGRGTAGTQFQSSLVELSRPGGFEGERAFALLAIVVAGAWLGAAALLGRGRSGRILAAVRDREVVAEARGVPVTAWRVGAFVFSIAIAAAAGALSAAQTSAVTPESFRLTLSLQIVAVALLAGVRRLEAAVLGAAVIVLAQEAAGLPVLNLIAGDRIDLVFGAGLILVLAMQQRRRPSAAGAAGAPHPIEMPAARAGVPRFADTVLRVDGVEVSFGAARVLHGVDLRAGRGEIVGLVGGNGAGKTTLFNAITGLVAPDEGRVFLDGADITDMAPHRRAQLGLARTFQGVEVFDGLTVIEGVMVAAGLRGAREEVARTAARAALAEVGIDHLAEHAPSSLPFASLRLVEIATALVADPSLLLLDEPLAGLDASERAVVLAAIERLRAQGLAILVVEHDRDSLARVADRTYELRDGRAHVGDAHRTEEVRVAARA
jgi:branched-chain amino acid transport system permease protein